MASLFIAFVASSLLYQNRVQSLIEDIQLTNARKIIQAYESTPSAELIPFMQSFSGISGNILQLYDPEGKPLLEEKKEFIRLEHGYIERVLAGNTIGSIIIQDNYFPIVGVPFQVKGEPHALFLTVQENPIETEIMNSIHVMYLLILLIGSLLIIVAARYLVKPILRLTEATRRMAKGTFDVELPATRKDEIGQLTRSFNEMAKELSKLDRMRQEFVSSVSHEIQSPLTSISGFSKALRQKQMSEESRIRYLTIIEEESERLSRLSQNLLRLSFLQHQNQPLKVSAYRLDEQLRRVVIAMEPQWSEKEIELEVAFEAITVQADEDQLGQVWTNLLSNSIKFTPPRGKILLEANANDHEIIVSITDTGIGIPEEERADIFKPFHKVDKARNSAVKGNGLGLSIVKQIIDLHKGEIQVSGRLGAGTTFTVTLPR